MLPDQLKDKPHQTIGIWEQRGPSKCAAKPGDQGITGISNVPFVALGKSNSML